MELDDILSDSTSVKLGNEVVDLDPKRMHFNEANLSKYQEEEAVWYDYFGRKLADAEYLLQSYEQEHDVKYSEKFASFKESGNSDKLADANAKADPEVEEAKKKCLVAKHKVKLLQQHLRAWDKNHDNAQNRAHTIRKELDKLHSDFYFKNRELTTEEQKLEDIIGDAKESD